MASSRKPVRVLIVDDSASVRQTLAVILASDPDIDVLGIASDPFIAAARIRDEVPDVITLDVEMPRMDGITFLRKLMAQHPIPVVMCSSLVEGGSETLMQALEAGAVDIILKPKVGVTDHLTESRAHICEVVKGAAQARVGRSRDRHSPQPPDPARKLTADAMLPPVNPSHARTAAMARTTETIICVGASTGGTESLREVLEALPPDAPGIVVVQHMPERFTAAFAQRLDKLCEMEVKEAANGDVVLRGRVLIAPGNLHTMIERSGARYFVSVKEGPLVSRHRPSVDVLFRSAARSVGANAVGVIMTGMGDDGARGLAEMRNTGAFTLAQDEATSIVFGMAKEAIARDGVEKIVPLHRLAQEILRAAAR
jgi:two-component system chemotaxis response regulator CheB